MNINVKLTTADNLVLESYKSVLEGLAEFIGPGYEIVLHSLEDVEHSAIKVINGHYTGRKEGAPITDLALEMLSSIKKSKSNKKSLIYINQSKRGTPIRSATIPIIGEKNKIIGLLCINFYMDMPLHTFLENIIKVPGDNKAVVETFVNNTNELILTTLENIKKEVYGDARISASNKNKEIITVLYQKDIFNLKGAVIKVAQYLGISKNTVYLHLRNIQNENSQ